MEHSVTIWCTVVGVLLLVFILKALDRYYSRHHHHRDHKPRHIIEMGKESEIFYVPGDLEEKDLGD